MTTKLTDPETIEVNRSALRALLWNSDGFESRDLGICWVDDGSGCARRLLTVDEAKKENAVKWGTADKAKS